MVRSYEYNVVFEQNFLRKGDRKNVVRDTASKTLERSCMMVASLYVSGRHVLSLKADIRADAKRDENSGKKAGLTGHVKEARAR